MTEHVEWEATQDKYAAALLSELERDTLIDEDHIIDTQVGLSNRIAKWVGYAHSAQETLDRLDSEWEREYNRLFHMFKFPQRGNKLMGGSDFNGILSNKGEYDSYVVTRPEMVNLRQRINVLKRRVKIVDSALHTLHNMRYVIKSTVDYIINTRGLR